MNLANGEKFLHEPYRTEAQFNCVCAECGRKLRSGDSIVGRVESRCDGMIISSRFVPYCLDHGSRTHARA